MTLYFAYGSNLHIEQMSHRCPGAVPIGRLRLKDWKLVFRGVADIVREPGAICYGGVWQITDACEVALDRYEGVAGGMYRREWIPLKRSATGDRQMLVYTMNSIGIMPPSTSYLRTIREGYEDHGMPKIAYEGLDAAVRESFDDKNPSHVERLRRMRTGRPPFARYPEEKVKKLPARRAAGLDPETIGDRIYAQHNAGAGFERR
jgi:hypothetical protein